MDRPIRICGVTVNHNTSHFVELMLRTLLLTNDLANLQFEITVLDNQSDDSHRDQLQAYLNDRNIACVQTGFDTSIAGEKHGVALAHFVREHPACTHFLFLDADMWFIEPNTIATMLGELEGAPDKPFGVQARILGYYAGQIIEGRDGVPGAAAPDSQPLPSVTIEGRNYTQVVMPRCSPVCSLIANTPVFRRVVEAVGLAPARRFGVGQVWFYDTFSLMTQVMSTHEQAFMISARSVNHFTQATYMPEHRAVKDHDCLVLLDDLRAGRGMHRASFYESDWVRQQRQKP